MLAWTIYISFLGVLGLLLLPKRSVRVARALALLTAVAGFVVTVREFTEQQSGAVVTGCADTMDPIARHRVLPGSGRHQFDFTSAHGPRRDCRRPIFLEYRVPSEGVLRVLSGADWWGVRRISELRFVVAFYLL